MAFKSQVTVLPGAAALDPTKHVKYTLGMVLGVQDFEQEHTYLRAHDEWLARDTVGYGTVSGLDVAVEVDAEGPRVSVSPGSAITPCGRLVCVTPAQCANLNDWLARHDEEVTGPARGRRVAGLARLDGVRPGRELEPAATATAYVVLCAQDCLTDDLPIPGEPCRTEDALSAPSRVKDDFRLELRLDPPPHVEERTIREVVDLAAADPGRGRAGLGRDRAGRRAAPGGARRPDAGAGGPGHRGRPGLPAAPRPGLTLGAARIREYLRAAFELWVTEIRPLARAGACDQGCGCRSAVTTAGSGDCGCGCGGVSGCDDTGSACGDDQVLLAALAPPRRRGGRRAPGGRGGRTARSTCRPARGC